jgi:hypothetical protein
MRSNTFGNHAEELLQANCESDQLKLNLYRERGGIYAETPSDLLNACSVCGSSRGRVRS